MKPFTIKILLPKKQTPPPKPVSRTARMLALAHFIEQQIESGALKDYAQISRYLGMTRARMTQVMALNHLSPTIQTSILSGELEITERHIRPVLKHMDWQEQKSKLTKLLGNTK